MGVLVKRADGKGYEFNPEGVSFVIADAGDQVFIHDEAGKLVGHTLLNEGDVVGLSELPLELGAE